MRHWKTVLICIAVAAACVFAVQLAIAEEERWQRFVIDNNCRKAGYIEGYSTTSFVYQPNGTMAPITTTIPRRNRWLCDKEVEIIR